MKWLIEGEVAHRVARKEWHCLGDGRRRLARSFAPGCPGKILKGQEHAEDLREASPFSSGTRHCMACARKFVL